MATNFPTGLDSLTNPTSTDTLASPSHSAQHANANDAIEALQAKVGVNSSAVTTSLDYLVRNINASTAIVSGSSAGDLVRITQTGAGNALVVEDSTNPDSTPFVIDPSGRLIVGSSSVIGFGLATPSAQVLGATASASAILQGRYSADVSPPTLYFAKSRNAAVGSHTIVQSGDSLGRINFGGSDGTDFSNSAAIYVEAEGTPAAGVVQSRFVFQNQNSIGALVDRMRIDSVGQVGIGATPTAGRTLTVGKAITGSTLGIGVFSAAEVQSDVTSSASMFRTLPTTQNAVFTLASLRHFFAAQGALGASSTVTEQIGFLADSTLTGAGTNYAFFGNIASGTGRWNLYMGGTANNYLAGSLGIGNTSLTGRRLVVGGNLTGAVASVGLSVLPTIQSDVTTSAYLVNTVGVTTASAFTLDQLHHFRADQQAFGAGSTVNTQYGFIVGATLVGATTNYGFYSNIPVGTGRWNLYMNGTADNYLAGRLGVGATLTSGAMMRVTNTTAADIALAVRGAAAQTGNLFEVQNSSGTGLMGVDDTGSLGIGTVNPVTLEGRRLLVTGSLTGKTTSVGVLVYPTVQSDVTTAYVVNTNGITAATAFTLGALHHFRADQGTFGAGSTVTDQIGFIAGSSLTGATNNFGFYGNIASGTGRWNLYMAGTAANYIAGRLGIGATLTSGAMAQITNTTAADNALVIKGASSQSGLLLDIENSAGTTLVSVSASGTILTRAGSTQDGVALAGRAGGTGDYEVTLTPTTLTADRTLTLPDVTGTAITTGNLSSITSVGTLTNVLESQGQNIYISGSTGSFVQHTTNTGSGNAAEWSIAFGSAVLVRNTSTRDDKENIQPLNGVLTPSMIDQIDVSLWTRKNSPDFPEVGPMAEDMDSISPFLATHGMDVDENENIVRTPPNGINRNAWMSLLTIALQDCRRRIEELESR